MATEASVGLVPDSTGKKARTVEVTKTDASSGSAAVVEQQIVSLADSAGNLIEDLYDTQQQHLQEYQAIESIDAGNLGLLRRSSERISLTDRRGATGRGSTR
jgi:hypothetical protein